jgi:hypothetical protein
MARTCFDSSALAKRYVEEPGSDHVARLCAGATEVVLSLLVIPELYSALNRLRRENSLDERVYEVIQADFLADVDESSIVDLSAALVHISVRILETSPLRTLDALHVATAISQNVDLFVTADQRQHEAATRAGIRSVYVLE